MKTRLIFLAGLLPLFALAQQAEDDDMYFNSVDRKVLASSKPTPKMYGSDVKDSGDELNPTDSYSGRGQNPQAGSQGKQDAYFTPDYTPKGVNQNNQYNNNSSSNSYNNCCHNNYYNRYSPYNNGWGMTPYNSMYYSPSTAYWNSPYYSPYNYGYDPYYSDPYYRNSYSNSMYYNSYYSNPSAYYNRYYVPQAAPSQDRKKSNFNYDNPPAGVTRQREEGNTNGGNINGRRAADNNTNTEAPLRQRTYNDNNTQSGWSGNQSSGSFGNGGGGNNNGGFSGGSGSGGGRRSGR